MTLFEEMNYTRIITLVILNFIYIQEVSTGFYNPITYLKCSFQECCNDDNVPQRVQALREALDGKLFGQEIAKTAIMNALIGHISSNNTPKALAMSFHGPTGSGKTFVAKMIMSHFYKKGDSSKFCHYFNGRTDFPRDDATMFYQQYRERLHNTIVKSLLECEQSMFIIDEVDTMTPKLLNVLVPFLDYGTTDVWYNTNKVRVITNKAIFIFLSNTGYLSMIDILLNQRKNGKTRLDAKMSDFERIIPKVAFEEEGGFEDSQTISEDAIDHYVPFLPLEMEHIKQCIRAAYEVRGRNATDEDIEDVMSHITFGPEPVNIYAKGGCRRVEQKVISKVYQSMNAPRSDL